MSGSHTLPVQERPARSLSWAVSYTHLGAGNNGGAAAGTLDGMATEQGYYALVAYQRLKDGKTGLYDMSDVSISKGGKGDGTGTGLKEPTPIPTPTSAPAADPSGSSGRCV